MQFFLLRHSSIPLTPTILMNAIYALVVISLIVFLAVLSLGGKPKEALKFVYSIILIAILLAQNRN
ncbi:hypothetical protein D3C80_926360 [compost metagenome]